MEDLPAICSATEIVIGSYTTIFGPAEATPVPASTAAPVDQEAPPSDDMI